jgi:thiamine biosynthesis lipoprotein
MRTAPAALEVDESHFRVMGTDAHLVVVGGDDAILRRGETHVRELEQRWSRFLETSEISMLNRHAGHPVVVSADTFDLVHKAVAAWELSNGCFDPTVGAALIAHGYDRDFSMLAATVPATPRTAPAPGAAAIELMPEINVIAVPLGVTLDPGGIGKGLAADLTASLLTDAGACGALVNLGGDLRAVGRAPTMDGWVITVPDPLEPGRELLRLAISDGAVATSSRLRRRWMTESGQAHHLIDPRTGRPAHTDVVAVTVVAAEGWWAEALTKALFLTGPAGLDDYEDLHAVIVTADGARHCTPGLEATLR